MNILTEKFILDRNWAKKEQRGEKILFISKKYNLYFNSFFIQLEYDIRTNKCVLIKDKVSTVKILFNDIIETEEKFDEMITKKIEDYETLLLL